MQGLSKIGDQEGKPAPLADREARTRGAESGEALRCQDRAERQHQVGERHDVGEVGCRHARARPVDHGAQRLHHRDGPGNDYEREHDHCAPAARIIERRQDQSGGGSAQGHAGLLDREDQVAMTARRVPMEDVGAGRCGRAVAEAHQQRAEQHERKEWDQDQQHAGAAEQKSDLQRPDRTESANERRTGQQEEDSTEGVGRREIADQGIASIQGDGQDRSERRQQKNEECARHLQDEGRKQSAYPEAASWLRANRHRGLRPDRNCDTFAPATEPVPLM